MYLFTYKYISQYNFIFILRYIGTNLFIGLYVRTFFFLFFYSLVVGIIWDSSSIHCNKLLFKKKKN